jgi:hypothetical protein
MNLFPVHPVLITGNDPNYLSFLKSADQSRKPWNSLRESIVQEFIVQNRRNSLSRIRFVLSLYRNYVYIGKESRCRSCFVLPYIGFGLGPK